MNACTIIARNYLAYARVLADSFHEHHPDGRFTACVLDDIGGDLDVSAEPFEVLSAYDIGIPRAEFHRMATIYDVMELATAVKPWVLRTLLDRGAPDVAYLDPDIQIFAPLDDVSVLAREHSIVLIPHVTEPMPRDGRLPSETTILQAGIYNLGFIAVSGEASAFLDWWGERLARECIVDFEGGRFVDQRWVDFVPGLFDHHILRDPGYNVAHWNLWARPLSFENGRYTVDGVPLRFYHFSGFDPAKPNTLSKHQGARPRVSPGESPALRRLYRQYAERLLERGNESTSRLPYAFDRLPDGTVLDRSMRRRYRDALIDSERRGKGIPPCPFDVTGDSDEGGQRAHADSPRDDTAVGGVNVAGYLRAELGIGEAARQIIAGIRSVGIPHATITYREGTSSRQEHPFEHERRSGDLHDVNLICVNADQIGNFARSIGYDFFRDRYSIGVWWWEVSIFPTSMHAGFDLVDEIWVGSDYAARAISPVTSKRVLKVPIPVSYSPWETIDRQELGLPDGFVFLFMFDFFSTVERKNPFAIIEAFKKAFGPGSGAKLVVKSINGDRVPDQLALLQRAAGEHPDIVVTDRYVSANEKNSYMAGCDCYVSLHRSEGFGLTMAEAMSHGKPVIATAYSGNLEFMDEENSFLVPYRLTSVPEGCDPYPPGAEWAEPDVEAAARLMRHVFEHPEEARERGERGRADLAAKHSPERTGEFIARRLREIAEETRSTGRAGAAARSEWFRAQLEESAPPDHSAAPLPWGWLFPRSRFWPVQTARRILNRLLRPYMSGQFEFGRTVANSITDHRDQLAEIVERLNRLEEEGRKTDVAEAVRQLDRLDASLRAVPYVTDPALLRSVDPLGRETIGYQRRAGTGSSVYRGFEDVFRGSENFIRSRQGTYLDFLGDREPVLDVGCGRGEFLDLLRERGIQAKGIDIDAGMVARCREKGHDVEETDLNDYLMGQADGTLGAIFAAQVIEHLPYDSLTRFLGLAYAKLADDGVLIAETVNPHSIQALKTFWVDLTHRSPIFPEVAVVLCGLHGFGSAFVVFPNGAGDLKRDLQEQGEYAVIARKLQAG